MAKITTTKKQADQNAVQTWKVELPTASYVQIYPRVSTPEQKKNVSAEMQIDKKFALTCGWLEELIIVDNRDLGLSGQLRMEDRPAFNEMNRKIASGQVKIVIVAQVDRLFRDRWGQEYAKFMEICYTYGVKVLTLNPTRTAIDFIYDFSISWHVDQFRRKCEEAWRYIEGHVYRMLGAREEAAKAGRWTGHNMPAGYMPDFREKVDGKRNPNYMRWMVYRPHLERMNWLYQRYRRLGGSLYDLFREINRQKDFFPPFEEDVPDVVLTHCRLLMHLFKDREEVNVEELRGMGFTVQSPEGLKRMLANPFYGGMLVYKGILIDSENHEPAIDVGTFLYAFNRLSPTNLDGTPNAYVEERKKVYAKRFKSKMVAALHGKIEAAYPGYKVYLRDTPSTDESRRKANPQSEEVKRYYAFYDYGEPMKHLKYLLPVIEVDGCFFKHFIKTLQDANEFEDYLEHEQKEIEQRQTDLEAVERDIHATKLAMQRIEESVEEITSKKLAEKVNARYAGLEQELARLEEKKVMILSTRTRAQRRMGYRELMKKVGNHWHEIVQAEQLPEMIDTFVEKVVLEPISPRFYTLTVYWRDPEWGVDELLCFREHAPCMQWSGEDDALLREKYPAGTAEELINLFPDRNPVGIGKRARRLGITCETTKDWSGYMSSPERMAARFDNLWAAGEDTILRERYATGTAEELLGLLPGRSSRSIWGRAAKLKLRSAAVKDWRNIASSCESILTPRDREVMERYGITEENLRVQDAKLLRYSKALSQIAAIYILHQS